MKKQLFLLVILLAFFAGISKVNAQCTPGPNTPAPGMPEDYTAVIAGDTYDGNGVYTWYVTTLVNVIDPTGIIAAGAGIFTVGTGAGESTYNSTTGTTETLNLTWLPPSVGNTYYLVLRYSEENTAADPLCTAENIRVWEIKPINTFLLAAASDGEVCPGDVTGALVTTGTPSTIMYTYDQTILTYTITASGLIAEWQPSIQIPALLPATATGGTGQNYADVEWSIDGTTWYDFDGAAGTNAGGNYTDTDGQAPVTEAGSDITIRITINNNNVQSLAVQNIEIGIDGVLWDSETTVGDTPDIIGSGTTPCDPESPFGKRATTTINARPTITAGTGTILLEP